MAERQDYLLGIGSVLTEAVTSKLKTASTAYRTKLLTSKPHNWAEIAKLVRDSRCIGVAVKLTGFNYETLVSDDYQDVAADLVAAIASRPHLVLVHENVAGLPDLAPIESDQGPDADEVSFWDGPGDDWNDAVARDFFGDVPAETRAAAHALLDGVGITVTTYKTNAEASVLAAGFVDDTLSNLLFRLYIPAGRMFEEELAKLLDMFRGWLSSVKSQTVRQAGYSTSRGRVIEFFAAAPVDEQALRRDLVEFTQFLDVVDQPEDARLMLVRLGVGPEQARDFVHRYAKEGRRVLLDIRQVRETRLLQLSHQLEAELSETDLLIGNEELTNLISWLLPASPFDTVRSLNSTMTVGQPIVFQQQIVQHVRGVVAQSIEGAITYNGPLDDIMRLIRQIRSSDGEELQAAALELADEGAPPASRLKARQKIKAFLTRNVDRIEAAAFATLWKWLETQMLGPH